MAGRLEGRVAIVTGAGRGIGRGEAMTLASEGAAVIVNDPGVGPDGVGQNSGPADEVVAEIKANGGNAAANYGNVTSYQDGEAMVQQALDTFGRLDILVNNAGILRDRMIFNMSEEEWDAVIAVHLKGHFTVTRHACVVFRQQRSGRIIGTSSTSGLGNMGQANYGAAKEGIAGMVRTLARDMGKYGVTANAIRPFAATRLTVSEEMMQARERARAAGVQRASNNEISELDPMAVAPLVTYLCTDAAQNINGRVFIVGGRQIGIYPEPEPVRTIFSPGTFWTIDEIDQIFPRTIGRGVKNEWEGSAQAASATTASP